MTQVRIRRVLAEDGVTTIPAQVALRLTDGTGVRIGWWTDPADGKKKPITQHNFQPLDDTTGDLELPLVPQEQIALDADETPTYWVLLIKANSEIERWPLQVPDSTQVWEAGDLVAAQAIPPGSILAGMTLTADERAALDAANAPSAANPIATIADTGPGGGVSDHGALTGLGDDDHAQYHTDARGDARYATGGSQDTHSGRADNPHGVTAAQIGVEAGATADQTAQEIATALDADATAEATLKSALGLGSAAYTASTAYATSAQGSTADTAIQPGDDAAALGSGAATDDYVLTADGAGGSAWEARGGGIAAPPSDGNYYAYKDGSWVNITNNIINP
jgi:hypothetical protein